VTQIPIACTLSAADKTTRGEEWRQFLLTNVAEIVRFDTSARMRLIGGDNVILTAVDLARREKDCCAFFDFRLVPLPDDVWLEVEVPADAVAILDDLVNSGDA
jgi:hypothetical protein